MRFKPGTSGNPGGQTKEQREERERVSALLLTEAMDVRWLAAYAAALDDGVAPIILDYAYRRLGKPKESVEMSGPEGAPLLPPLSQTQVTQLLDALATKGKP